MQEIKITDEIAQVPMAIGTRARKELKQWGYTVESESPLKLVPIVDSTTDPGLAKEVLIGIPAYLIVKDAMDKDGFLDELNLSSLDTMSDDDYLLVTADVNYADEFDMREWLTMTVGEFKKIAEDLKEYADEIEWYFGTNEDMRFNDGQDLLNQLSFKTITIEEYDALDRLFSGGFDGGCGVFEHINELDFGGEESDEAEEELSGVLDSSELRKIEKLKAFGWEIEVFDEANYLLEYKNVNGDYAITHTGVIEDLIEYHKRNK